MVERSACSTGEETNGTSSVKSSGGVGSVRNDGFVLLGTGDADNKRQTQGFQVILEPEVGNTLEASRLESNRGSASSGSTSATSRFSLFKWFKRGSRESTSSADRRRRKRSARTSSPGEEDPEEPEVSVTSSTESVDTFYSTATVRSFAFHSGTLRSGEVSARTDRGPTSLDLLNHTQRKVGPFGAGASKLVVKKESRREGPSDVTRTLPANVLSRRRDITARYSLQPCTGFGSCGNFGGSQRGLSGSLRRLDDRGTARRVHVRGKRRAPNPPVAARPKIGLGPEEAKISRGSGRKKRRPAPKPPERNSVNVNVDVTSVKDKVNVREIENSGCNNVSPKIGEAKPDFNAEDNIEKEATTCSVNSVATSTHLVQSPDKVSGTEADKPTETGQTVVCTRDPEVTKNLPAETSSTPRENEDSEASTLDLSQSISNDTLILHGGVLHWKKEANSTLTSKTGGTNVIGGASEKESTLRAPLARSAITTGSQTSAMPRPWYKRSVFEHSRDTGSSKRGDVLRNPVTLDAREEPVVSPGVTGSGASASPKTPHAEKGHNEGGTLSRLNFFHRGERNLEERRKENKRKSGLSILTNISELDKEAAAIVQEEQARTRAASMLLQASRIGDHERRNDQVNEEVVQDMVTSAMESSPRRGTRALISKFNAIGNITKVTVNTSFFSKSGYPRDQREEKLEDGVRSSRLSQNDDWRNRSKFQVSERSQNVRVEKDLSRYFLPQQSSPKTRTNPENEGKTSSRESPKSSRAAADISTRLSFLQGSAPKTNNPSSETSLEARISRLNDEVVARNEKDAQTRKETHEDSPKLSRLRVHVINSEVGKLSQSEVNDKKKGVRDEISKPSGDSDPKKNVEIIQKEFSSIFNEIDKQFAAKESPGTPGFRDKVEKKQEAGTSSQVSRVLDILVEAEKGDRLKVNWSKPKETEILCGNSENPGKVVKNFVPSSSENPAKMDLKEMLKEMKHSLPKRPKPKKPCANREIPAENEEKRAEDVKTDVKVPLDDGKRNTSYLMNSVTVVYPPPIRIGPPMNPAKATNPPVNEEREYERQKVSSAAQTCGNVRKVTRPIGTSSSGSPKWRNEDVVYRTSGKGFATPGTSGLVKNTFQLIRPREFAQIEAIKTMKSCKGENTYANVIERESMYANALVPAPKRVPQGLPTGPKKEEPKCVKEAIPTLAEERKRIFDNKVSTTASEAIDEVQDARTAVDQQNMNTLAVNRLLRKLEAAIASGHHQQAAGLAKELARLKIHCSVVRQRTKAKDVINVNMYIEDKLAHQGPIPLRLTRSMTVAQLKAKVFTEFEIPANVQRWIVGKNLADDDATTLEELQAVEGSPVFLYLVAPELKVEEPPGKIEKTPVAEELQIKDPNPEPAEEIAEAAAVEEVEEEKVEEEEVQAEVQVVKEDEEEEEEEEDECISEEVRMERYEALISLENCDVIPNSEPIECPICFVTYGPQEGVILRDCLHMFCRPCIANTIRYCEEAEVKCPFRDTEYTCESTLQEREIKALVEPEVYQQHLAKSIAQAENNAGNNAFHCKTPDCPGWCIYDDNVNNFLCPVCGVNNCLTCQVVHTGKNCRQYQQELRFSKETDQESKRTAAMLEEMVDRGEALPCPTCAVVLMKKWGCDWLRCSMCKTEICWVTRGPRWGPGGKGDTSGGCRCGENGVKCHPRCNYCH